MMVVPSFSIYACGKSELESVVIQKFLIILPFFFKNNGLKFKTFQSIAYLLKKCKYFDGKNKCKLKKNRKNYDSFSKNGDGGI